MTYGTFEAKLAEILTGFEAGLPENIKLAYLPASGVIKLRLTGTGTEHESLSNMINDQVKKLIRLFLILSTERMKSHLKWSSESY